MKSPSVRLRKHPFPFRAALSISSDLDGTRSYEDYVELLRFFNTATETSLGTGLDLEFANSLYFAMPEKQFAYWNIGADKRAKTRELLQLGFIDTLHSFGDGVRDKRSLTKSLEEIIEYGMRFPIWINHSAAPTNLSSARRPGKFFGDSKDHELYHVKKLLAHGLAYVCRGQATSVIGQETAPDPSTIFYAGVSPRSCATAAMQAAKLVASPVVSRYRMHLRNRILAPTVLDDGSAVTEIMRANWFWGGLGRGANLRQVDSILTKNALETLVRRQGTSVFNTHLGRLPRVRNDSEGRSALNGLRTLAGFAHDRQVLVKTTVWLLDYLALRNNLEMSIGQSGELSLEIGGQADMRMADRLASFLPNSGLSFYFDGDIPPDVSFRGETLKQIELNPPDHTGSPSVSLPMDALKFPAHI